MDADMSPAAILSAANEFACEVLRPRAREFDRAERLPREIIDEMAKNRFLMASMPPDYGGLGLGAVDYGLLTEEIGRACCATRGLMTVECSLIGETLLRWGTQDQRNKWLPAMARAEKIGAFALTEPDFGTDARGIQTRYRKSGNAYVINGAKKWISFAEIADFFLVIATDDSQITAFIVEAELPGITRHPQKGLMGNRAAHLAEVVFKDVVVPAENIVGQSGGGFSFIAATALDHGRYSIAWAGVAVAQEALDAMVAYARRRRQFGRQIAEFQLIQRLIAKAVAGTHAARSLCIRAGKLRESGNRDAAAETTIAKYFTSKVAVETAGDALQVHGGNGCWDQYPVERLYREAKVLEIIEGTSQIQQQMIAKFGLRRYGRHCDSSGL